MIFNQIARKLFPTKVIIKPDLEFMMRYVARSLRPDSVFVNIGAYDGVSSKKLCETVGLDPQNCHLIEACPTNYALLEKNCPGFRNYQLAISSKDGVVPFYIVDRPGRHGSSTSNSLNRRALEARFGSQNVRTVEVKSIRLDHFFKEQNLRRVDFTMINAEGAEYEIFDGDLSFLSDTRIIYLALHGKKFNDEFMRKKREIYERLIEIGFNRIAGHRLSDIGVELGHMTFLFERLDR